MLRESKGNGYIGNCMSRNALQAYRDGEINTNDMKVFLKNLSPLFKGITNDIINRCFDSTIHHVGSDFKEVRFFDIGNITPHNLEPALNELTRKKIGKEIPNMTDEEYKSMRESEKLNEKIAEELASKIEIEYIK